MRKIIISWVFSFFGVLLAWGHTNLAFADSCPAVNQLKISDGKLQAKTDNR